MESLLSTITTTEPPYNNADSTPTDAVGFLQETITPEIPLTDHERALAAQRFLSDRYNDIQNPAFRAIQQLAAALIAHSMPRTYETTELPEIPTLSIDHAMAVTSTLANRATHGSKTDANIAYDILNSPFLEKYTEQPTAQSSPVHRTGGRRHAAAKANRGSHRRTS